MQLVMDSYFIVRHLTRNADFYQHTCHSLTCLLNKILKHWFKNKTTGVLGQQMSQNVPIPVKLNDECNHYHLFFDFCMSRSFPFITLLQL